MLLLLVLKFSKCPVSNTKLFSTSDGEEVYFSAYYSGSISTKEHQEVTLKIFESKILRASKSKKRSSILSSVLSFFYSFIIFV